jgi:hypothetical protein
MATSLKTEDHATCPYMKQTAKFSFVYLQNVGKQMGQQRVSLKTC